MANVWSEALSWENRENLVENYVKMLEKDSAADIYNIENHISQSTAKIIWDYYQRKDPENTVFFYSRRSGDRVS